MSYILESIEPEFQGHSFSVIEIKCYKYIMYLKSKYYIINFNEEKQKLNNFKIKFLSYIKVVKINLLIVVDKNIDQISKIILSLREYLLQGKF